MTWRNFDTELDRQGVVRIVREVIREGEGDRPTSSVEGERLAQEGMARVISHSDDEWKTLFLETLDEFAATRQPFTAEDIRERVGLPAPGGSPRNNVVGALMNGASRRGLIRWTGEMIPARYARTHAHPIRVWVGV